MPAHALAHLSRPHQTAGARSWCQSSASPTTAVTVGRRTRALAHARARAHARHQRRLPSAPRPRAWYGGAGATPSPATRAGIFELQRATHLWRWCPHSHPVADCGRGGDDYLRWPPWAGGGGARPLPLPPPTGRARRLHCHQASASSRYPRWAWSRPGAWQMSHQSLRCGTHTRSQPHTYVKLGKSSEQCMLWGGGHAQHSPCSPHVPCASLPSVAAVPVGANDTLNEGRCRWVCVLVTMDVGGCGDLTCRGALPVCVCWWPRFDR